MIIAKHYNTQVDILNKVLKEAFKINTKELSEQKKDIILPYCGKIFAEKCKGIVFNHGLYTQCIKETHNEVCKSCSKLKYGRIEERIKSKIGEFVNPDGKKEIPYEKFMSKMGYTIEEVKKALSEANLTYGFKEKTKQSTTGRGRPKKIQTEDSDSEDKEEIDVTNININGTNYYKTKDNIILDKMTYEVIGVLKNGSIEVIE